MKEKIIELLNKYSILRRVWIEDDESMVATRPYSKDELAESIDSLYRSEIDKTEKEIASLRQQLEKLDQCKNIIAKVKEANTPDKRSFEEAEKDKAYLNECIAKAEPIKTE